MVEINLLPWRDQKYQYERKIARRFMFAGVFAALLLLCAAHYFINLKIVQQTQRVEQLRALSPALSAAASPIIQSDNEWLAPIYIIKLLNAVLSSGSHGICYRSIMRAGNAINFSGNAWSLASLSSSLHSLETAALFDMLHVSEIKKPLAGNYFQFVIDAGQSRLRSGA